MAVDVATHLTYSAVGNREDLSDMIYRIDPTDTPFVTGIEREKATAVNHEWQTQALAAVNSTNSVLEGDDAITDTATPTVRLGNICQIQDKVARVSGTQQAVEHAGRDNELAYQEMLKGLELRRDQETTVVGTNQAKVAGAAGTPRAMASVISWIKTNTNSNNGTPGGSSTSGNPAAADGTGTRTDSTQRAITEGLVKTVLQSIWNNGGKPDVIMVGGFNKQQLSQFVGRATPMENSEKQTIQAAADVYRGDFGTLKIVPNRFMRQRDVLILQMDLWAASYLSGRRFVSSVIAKTGDSDRKQILSEWTLTARNEKGSGGVFDLTTS